MNAVTETEANRFRKLKADLAETTLLERRGVLLPRQEVEQSLSQAGQTLRDLMMDSVSRLPESLSGMTVRETSAALEKEFKGILEAFADQTARVTRQNGNGKAS